MTEQAGEVLSQFIFDVNDIMTPSIPILYEVGGRYLPAAFSYKVVYDGIKHLSSLDTLFVLEGGKLNAIDFHFVPIPEEIFSQLCKKEIHAEECMPHEVFVEYTEKMIICGKEGALDMLKEEFIRYVPDPVIRELYKLVAPNYVSSIGL